MIAEKDFAGRQTRGKRKQQEDCYAFSDVTNSGGPGERVEGLFVVVADGMGGHTSGEQASELAVETFADSFHLVEGTIRQRFHQAAHAANDAIAHEMEESPDLEGMGTTLVAATVTAEGLEWISVGDSPLYLWHDGQLERLNEDHSFRPVLHEMVESGEIRADDISRHPLKNLLRSALIGREIEMIDQPPKPHPLEEGDVVIVATDGLQTMHDDQIAGVLEKTATFDASAIASALLEAVHAVDYPKQDNATVAVIKAAKGGFIPHERKPAREDKKKSETTVIMTPMKEKE